MAAAVFLFLMKGLANGLEIDVLSNLCTGRRTSIEDLRRFALQVFSLEGKKRVSCGLAGEHYKICKSCQENITPEQMNTILPMLERPEHKEWHSTWHTLTGLKYSLLKKVGVKKYVETGWLQTEGQIEDIACSRDSVKSSSEHGGESFLYMHREMLKMAQAHLVSKGKGCFKGWNDLPPTVDNTIASVSKNASTLQDKTKELQRLKRAITWDTPDTLKKMTLDDVGCKISKEIHGNLHRIWSESPIRCLGFLGKCDNLTLANTSPFNSHFWMIHGTLITILENG